MADRVGIELALIGYDGIYNDAKKLQDTLNKLSHTKVRIEFESELRRLETQLRELQTRKTQIINTTKDKGELSALNKQINETKTNLLNLKQMGKNAIFTDQTWERYFNRLQAKIVQTGSRLQTLGKAITGITSPFTRFFSGMIMGAGFAAINKITSGFSGMFERYDTMMNYSRSLSALGFSADDAQKSVEKLNESVLGLPTGLDEIVAAQKIYVGATGDLTKATDLAIAANNTFLASGTQSREQRFIQKYLSALGSGADLTAAQWASMSRIAPLAMRAVAKELGYADDKYKEFNTDLQKGNIESEKFLDAFIKIGTSGVVADAANVMKMSWEGLSANLGNATKRMGESALKAVDEVFKAYNGRTLLQTLLGVDANGNAMGDGIKDWINGLSQELQNWIKANPARITEFFENLKKIDVAGMLKGTAEAIMNIADAFVKITSKIDISNLGKIMIYGSLLGKFLTVTGGFVKGFAGVARVLGKFAVGKGLLGGIGGLFGGLGKIFGGIKSIFGSGTAFIGSAFASKKLAGGLIGMGSVGKAAGTMATGWMGVANKALTIAAIPIIAGSIKLAVSALKDLSELNMSWDRFGHNMGQLIIVFGAFATIAGILGAFPVATGAIAAGAGAMAAVGAALSAVADGLAKISTMQVPSSDTIRAKLEAMRKIIGPLKDIIKLFDEGGIFANIHKMLQNFSAIGVIASIGKVVDAVEGVVNKAKQLGKAKIGPKTLAKVQKVKDGFDPVAKLLQSIIDEFDQGFWANIGERLTNWSAEGVITSIGNVAQKVTNFVGAVKQLGGAAYDPMVIGRAGMWLTGIEELVAAHYVTMSSWNSNHFASDIAGFVEALKNIGSAFGQISILLEHFDNIIVTFRKYQASGSFTMGDPFGSVRNRVGLIVDFVEELGGEGGDLERLSLLSQYMDVGNIKKVADSISGMEAIIRSLGSLSYQMQNTPLLQYNDAFGGMNMTALKGVLTGLVDDLIVIVTAFDRVGTADVLKSKVVSFKNAFDKMSEMFSSIKDLAAEIQGGMFTEVATIKAAIAEVTSIGDEEIKVPLHIIFDTNFGDSYNVACESIKNVADAIVDYAEMLDAHAVKPVEIRFYANIVGLQSTLFQIDSARRAIRTAIQKIPTNVTRKVRIDVSPKYPASYYESSGGLIGKPIYRAGGGFTPRGTDTVPAMLTPGEFVIRNRAVKAFGSRFMERVNSLDIEGAIRALHSRVGSTMMSSRKMVVNNNNTDNRSYSNVQNITTNNPNFAFRRSRWVSELR